MNKPRVLNNLGYSSLISPSIKQRMWIPAVTSAALVGSATFLASGLFLWKDFSFAHLPWPYMDFLKDGALTAINQVVPFVGHDAHERWLSNWNWLHQNGADWSIKGRLLIQSVLAGALTAFSLKDGLRPQDGYIHIRGRRLLDGPEALSDAQLKAAGDYMKGEKPDYAIMVNKRNSFMDNLKRRLGMEVPPESLVLGLESWSKHFSICGSIGGGKTTIINHLMRQIAEKNDKALIFDVKGDFTAKFKKFALMAPWDSRSLAWDIASDCRTRQDAQMFAKQLIEDSKDPMWANASRQILVGLLCYLMDAKKLEWGWNDIKVLLNLPDGDLLKIMEVYNPEAIRSLKDANQTTSGIMINLSAYVAPVVDLANAWKDTPNEKRFSFVKWLFDDDPKMKNKQLIIQGNGRFEILMKAYASSAIMLLSSRMNSPEFPDSKKRRLWMVLDEFPQIGKIEIAPMIALGRSKGVRVVLGYQDINQIKQIYSEEEANAWTSMIKNHIFARVAPGETAKLISSMTGTREVERANLSYSYSNESKSSTFMYNREELPVITETEMSTLLGPDPKRGKVRALYMGFDNANILEWDFVSLPDQRPSYKEASWVNKTTFINENATEYMKTRGLVLPGSQKVADFKAGSAGGKAKESSILNTSNTISEKAFNQIAVPTPDISDLDAIMNAHSQNAIKHFNTPFGMQVGQGNKAMDTYVDKLESLAIQGASGKIEKPDMSLQSPSGMLFSSVDMAKQEHRAKAMEVIKAKAQSKPREDEPDDAMEAVGEHVSHHVTEHLAEQLLGHVPVAGAAIHILSGLEKMSPVDSNVRGDAPPPKNMRTPTMER